MNGGIVERERGNVLAEDRKETQNMAAGYPRDLFRRNVDTNNVGLGGWGGSVLKCRILGLSFLT